MLSRLQLSFCLKSKGYRNDIFDVFGTGPEDSSDTGTLAEGPTHVPTLAGWKMPETEQWAQVQVNL